VREARSPGRLARWCASRPWTVVGIWAVALSVAIFSLAGGGKASAAPTCSTTLGIDHHGQHVVGDYVIGSDGTGPGGGEGAEIPGGPGPGFHFPNGFAPGASCCLLQSQSSCTHLGP
jgi:hypothetical protein